MNAPANALLTVINASFEYAVDRNEFPLITTRKAHWKPAIAELLELPAGYDSAAQFRASAVTPGTRTPTTTPPGWPTPPQGTTWGGCTECKPDAGKAGRHPAGPARPGSRSPQTRGGRPGEIITFYNPGEFELGCLRPACTHTFSLLGARCISPPISAPAMCPLWAGVQSGAGVHPAGPDGAYHRAPARQGAFTILSTHIYEGPVSPDAGTTQTRLPRPRLHQSGDQSAGRY